MNAEKLFPIRDVRRAVTTLLAGQLEAEREQTHRCPYG